MPSADIKAGVCGFTTRATAQCQDGAQVKLAIDSECPNFQPVAKELTEVDAFAEVLTGRWEGKVWKTCRNYLPHASCPVPAGLLKLIEVAAGLALPQTASIEVHKDPTT